jgi:phosphate transport system substrate-binding protein
MRNTARNVALLAAGILVAAASRPAPGQQIVLDGSTGWFPLTKELVQAFKARNGSAPFEFGSGSSSLSALRAVGEGRLAIAISSRALGEAERAAGLHGVEVARSAVVFAANASVGIAGLTADQVCAIYAGRIKNWKEVGGPDLAVIALTRNSGASDMRAVRNHLPCFKAGDAALPLVKSEEMAKVLTAKAGTIGFTNLTMVDGSRGRIRALALSGTAPTPENLQNGSYAMVRRFFLVTQGAPAGPAAQLVAFVKSADGERVIRAHQAVPVK